MARASPAIRAAGHLYGLVSASPNVVRDQPVVLRLELANQKLDGRDGLHGGDDPGRGPENASRVASGLGAGSYTFFACSRLAIEFNQASQARRLPGANRHGDPVTRYDGGINPGDATAHGVVIDEQAGLEIVGPIKQQRESSQQFV